ncbi:MAG: hypothetical protein EOP07_01575 [Proteobacteria bacterium]|nr:MAG: hypothetical protein EOP07_01575 [Pseudomonadota bacterium]
MKTFLPLTLFLLATACAQPAATTTTKKSSEQHAAEAEAKVEAEKKAKLETVSAENEAANIPNQISGALLTCAFASDPKIVKAEIAVGCRFEDKAGTRVALKDIADLSIFSFEAPKDSKAVITVQPLIDTSTYEVAYFVTDKDQDASKATALDTKIKVAFKNLKSGDKDQGLSVKLSSILQKALAYIKELKALGAAGYAVVSSKASVLKDAAVEKAKEAGTAVGNAADQAKSVFDGIFGG